MRIDRIIDCLEILNGKKYELEKRVGIKQRIIEEKDDNNSKIREYISLLENDITYEKMEDLMCGKGLFNMISNLFCCFGKSSYMLALEEINNKITPFDNPQVLSNGY